MAQSKGETIFPVFYNALKTLRNDLLALKSGYKLCLWPAEGETCQADSIYIRAAVDDQGGPYLEYQVIDPTGQLSMGRMTRADLGEAVSNDSTIIAPFGLRTVEALTEQDLEQAKLFLYNILNVTSKRKQTRDLPTHAYQDHTLDMNVSSQVTSLYRGMHYPEISTDQLDKNKRYYDNLIQAGLDIDHSVMWALDKGSNPKASWTESASEQYVRSRITTNPLLTYFASDSTMALYVKNCKQSMDNITKLPKVFDEKTDGAAAIYIKYFTATLRDEKLQAFITQEFNPNKAWIEKRTGEKTDIDPAPNIAFLIQARQSFARRKKCVSLLKEAVSYKEWQSEWQALQQSYEVLMAELSQDLTPMNKKIEDLEIQQRALVLLNERLLAFPTLIVQSGYLDVSTDKSKPLSKKLQQQLDTEWEKLVAQEQDSFTDIQSSIDQYKREYQQRSAQISEALSALNRQAASLGESNKRIAIVVRDELQLSSAPLASPAPPKKSPFSFFSVKTRVTAPPSDAMPSSKKDSIKKRFKKVFSFSSSDKHVKLPQQTSPANVASSQSPSVEVNELEKTREREQQERATRQALEASLTQYEQIYHKLAYNLLNAHTSTENDKARTAIYQQMNTDEKFFKQALPIDVILQARVNALKSQRIHFDKLVENQKDIDALIKQYFNGPMPVSLKIPKDEGQFNGYLRKRLEKYGQRDMFVFACVALIGGFLWYETEQARREKYVVRLQTATQSYRDNPCEQTIRDLNEVLDEELDKKPSMLTSYGPHYFSRKPPQDKVEPAHSRTFKGTLKQFKQAFNIHETQRQHLLNEQLLMLNVSVQEGKKPYST